MPLDQWMEAAIRVLRCDKVMLEDWRESTPEQRALFLSACRKQSVLDALPDDGAQYVEDHCDAVLVSDWLVENRRWPAPDKASERAMAEALCGVMKLNKGI